MFLKFVFNQFIFNWQMIASQCCVGFCHITLVLLPGNFQGQRLAGYSPWGCEKSDTTEHAHTHTHTHNIMIKYHCCCGIAPEDNWSQVLQFNVKSWTLPAECLAPTSRLPEHRLSLLYVDTKLQNSKMRPGLSLLLSVRHHESGGGTWKIAPLSLTPGFGGAHISTS